MIFNVYNFPHGFYLEIFSYNTLTNNNANSNDYGIYLENSDFNDLIDNRIEDNNNSGVYFSSTANYNNLNSNLICGNGLDVNDSDSNSGDDNTCDITYNWNDTDAKGCTTPCTPTANITAYQITSCGTYPIPQNPIYENTAVTFDGSNSAGTIVSYWLCFI